MPRPKKPSQAQTRKQPNSRKPNPPPQRDKGPTSGRVWKYVLTAVLPAAVLAVGQGVNASGYIKFGLSTTKSTVAAVYEAVQNSPGSRSSYDDQVPKIGRNSRRSPSLAHRASVKPATMRKYVRGPCPRHRRGGGHVRFRALSMAPRAS